MIELIFAAAALLFIGYGFSGSFMKDSNKPIRIMLLFPYGGIMFAIGFIVFIVVMLVWHIAMLPLNAFKEFKKSIKRE